MSGASLRDRFAAHLASRGHFEGPGLALLAVSGGPDSMALLDLAASVLPDRAVTLHVVHADHGIHPRSAEVAAQVSDAAHRRYGLETDVAHLDLGPDASETRAREARYAFFRHIQRRRDARWLVTAHHADDQAETVLLRLLRGSAPVGLAGIAERGPGALVRPLLPFRRLELAEHARETGLPVFDDPANADSRHTRSWVRTALLPLLEARLGGHALGSLLEVAGHAAEETAAWDALLGVLPGLDVRTAEGSANVARGVLAGYDKPLAVRILRAAAHRAGLRLGPQAAERAVQFIGDASSGRRIELGEGLTIEAAFDRLVLSGPEPPAPAPAVVAGAAGELRFGRHRLAWQPAAAPERLERGGWTTWLAPGALTVRTADPGESLVPLGGVGHREVRRLMMDAQVPRGERGAWPVVVWNGDAAWVPGVCRAACALPEPGTAAVRIDVTAG